ncbi:MAG: hypothetical protein J7K95_05595 [Thermoplasmata archaeon]|nr:hypothetical protein [Thermoplasmata archaeon]
MKKLAVFAAVLFLLPVANSKILVEVAVKDDEESNAYDDIQSSFDTLDALIL